MHCYIPDNIYPARGRKPYSGHWLLRGNSIPDNIYPARGRKPFKTVRPVHWTSNLFPTIFTPQGDGNELKWKALSRLSPSYSRQYLPRKGTETTRVWSFIVLPLTNSRQYLPRKGTETLSWDAKANWYSLSDSRQYLPRKGTETMNLWNYI